MKSIYKFVIFIFLIIFTSCENNKGPFSVEDKNEQVVLMSGKKPAKGMVIQEEKDPEKNMNVKIFEGNFNNGIPEGNFKYYDLNGVLKLDFQGKMAKDGNFVGQIKVLRSEEYSEAELVGADAFEKDYITNYTIDVLKSNFDFKDLLDFKKMKTLDINDISKYLIEAKGVKVSDNKNFTWVNGIAYREDFIKLLPEFEKNSISESKEKSQRILKLNENMKITTVSPISYYGDKSNASDNFASNFYYDNYSFENSKYTYNLSYHCYIFSNEIFEEEKREAIIRVHESEVLYDEKILLITSNSGNIYNIKENGEVLYIGQDHFAFLNEVMELTELVKNINSDLEKKGIKIDVLDKLIKDNKLIVTKWWDIGSKESIWTRFPTDVMYTQKESKEELEYVEKFFKMILPLDQESVAEIESQLKEKGWGTIKGLYEKGYLFTFLPGQTILEAAKMDKKLSKLFHEGFEQDGICYITLTKEGKAYFESIGGLALYEKIEKKKLLIQKEESATKDIATTEKIEISDVNEYVKKLEEIWKEMDKIFLGVAQVANKSQKNEKEIAIIEEEVNKIKQHIKEIERISPPKELEKKHIRLVELYNKSLVVYDKEIEFFKESQKVLENELNNNLDSFSKIDFYTKFRKYAFMLKEDAVVAEERRKIIAEIKAKKES